MTLIPEDLRIDVYRKRNQLGGWMTYVDTAIRITHVPSGVYVEEFNDRSQHRNRAEAFRKLQVVADFMPELFEPAPITSPTPSPHEIMAFMLDMQKLLADGQKYRELLLNIEKLQRYKQTWDSTAYMFEADDGKYVLLDDVRAMVKK